MLKREEQSLANGFGEMFIAMNVIVMRVDGFAMMPNFSFGTAMTTYSFLTRAPELPNGRQECVFISFLSLWLIGVIITFIFYKRGMWKEKVV